jgi:hypothetical protein
MFLDGKWGGRVARRHADAQSKAADLANALTYEESKNKHRLNKMRQCNSILI